ncbi:MAG: response regulator [Verrucomicrobiales bacterium]|nr:response regulator [Verrucomicrobiales bacterium]
MSTHTHHSIPPVIPPANCFTVLVIDDMAPNRMLLGKFLKSAGYAVFEATNGIEALELLREQAILPDLIITDVEMPVMDGITMIEQIRYLDSSVAAVPIITASGNADDEMRSRAIQAGSSVFMSKPFDLKALQKEIARLLTARRRSSQRIGGETLLQQQNRLDSKARLEVEN